jgi:hypothetical protein
MPVDYVLENGGALVHVRATGHLLSQEINDHLLRLASDPQLQSAHDTLFDASEVTSEALDDADFERTLQIERENPGKLVARKMAIVVRPNSSLHTVAMRYKFLSPTIGEPTHVFTDMADALAWLSY